jgi:ProP effector
MADMNRPASRVPPRAGRGDVSPGSDDAPQKSIAQASAQDIRADTIAAIELFRELFPHPFPLYGARLPLKIGIEAEIMRAVRGAMKPHEVTDAVRFYVSSSAYLRCLRPWAVRIDLVGNPVGIVTAADAAQAAETLATRLIKAANRKDARNGSATLAPLTAMPYRLGSRDSKTTRRSLLNREASTAIGNANE